MARAELTQAYVAPRNMVEHTVMNIWEAVLGLQQIGMHDNFFQIGGDSLQATQIFSRLKQAFTIEISLRELFTCQTIAQLSTIIQQRTAPLLSAEDRQYYCIFDLQLGDEIVTISMNKNDYLCRGLPENARNVRLLGVWEFDSTSEW